ncbi:MAG: ribbon-helix-helix domain-containing protein [Actinomycetota bacterium]
MTQLVARISPDLLAEIDRLVEEGAVGSRSEAVRQGLRALIDSHRRAAVGRQIADGYRRVPTDEDLDAWAEAAGRAMIEAEPW